jgi:uncharacterized protein (DUF2252 family)
LSIKRKIFAALAMAIVLPLTAAASMPVGASTPVSAKSLTKDLLPASFAKKVGFTKVARKVATSSETDLASCPHGAQVTFETALKKTDLASEVVACTNSKAAVALLQSSASGATAVTTEKPPGRLGSSAIEHVSGGIYEIVWLRGAIVEAVALNVDLPAYKSSPTVATQPITPAEQTVLSSAAVAQDAQLR